MKILFSLLLCLCLGAPAAPASAQLRTVTATVFPVWLLLREVTKDVPGISTALLLPAGAGCPHDYAMTPNDRRKLAQTDVLVMNGLGLESFLGEKAKALSLLKAGASIVDASHGVRGVIASNGHEEHGHAHDENSAKGSHACSVNPHIFASPSMLAAMSRSIASQLAALDSAHADLYKAGGEKAASRLEALADECRTVGEKLASRVIVAQHDIFDYLARDMGLDVAAHVQSHDGQEASARAMLDLVRLIRAKGVGAVIVEPQYPARTGRTLAAETKIPCVSLDPAANGPTDIASPLDWYENIMRGNLRALEQALGTR